MKRLLTLIALVMLILGANAFSQDGAVPKPPVGIPADARYFNGKWYRVYLEKGGWKRARERCAALGGRLAVVPDEETQGFITQLAESLHLWLGATDEKVEGQWIWSDGTKMIFTAWDNGQPQQARNENYLSTGPTGRWHDAFEAGDRLYVGFICEWKRK